MSRASLGPLGFVLLMLGFGLRLDSSWQGTAWVLLAGGAICAGLAAWPDRSPPAPHAFVLPQSRR
ncbi:MAG TPA: hypothetical protein VKA21_12640 [Candidatus Binatia bacterium]|nr:hypothetical protein [Candidatus Binatia bacterium]